MTPKVTVIIPSYNRFDFLLNALASVGNQSYKNLEIIIVNDNSQDERYYDQQLSDRALVIHLKENSQIRHGFACAGGDQRNYGLKIASGDYIAFLDDDDIWLPNKIETQLIKMKHENLKMCCSDALLGRGPYNKKEKHPWYNKDTMRHALYNKHYKTKFKHSKGELPAIWSKSFLKIHNCAILSTMMITRDIFKKVGLFSVRRSGDEDYDYWLRCLKHTSCIYIDEPLAYYDNSHGHGQNWGKK